MLCAVALPGRVYRQPADFQHVLVRREHVLSQLDVANDNTVTYGDKHVVLPGLLGKKAVPRGGAGAGETTAVQVAASTWQSAASSWSRAPRMSNTSTGCRTSVGPHP